MAVALGLLAALLWGAADFLIRATGRSLGIVRSMIYAHGFGALATGVWILAGPARDGPARDATLGWIAAVGSVPIGLAATVALYRALQVGRVGLVSPITGAYGAVAAVLAVLSGERLSAVASGGIAAVVAGAILVSMPARGHAGGNAARPNKGGALRGLAWACAASIGFGLQLWIQGRFAVPELGPVLPVFAFYALSTAALATAALVRRTSLVLTLPAGLTVLATAVVAVAGYVALSIGMESGHVAVVTVLSSLQSAITVGLACVFLGERMAAHQIGGLAAVVAGLVLLRAG